MDTSTVKTSPKDFFLYVLSNVALYYCAGWLVSLLYDYINYTAGSVNYYYDTSWIPSSMRWAIASLVIVFPVYVWVTHRLNNDLEANPEKRGLWIRKWLMYLTLALASVALVIDLIALVNEFLSGEFTTTFLLKVLAVAVVSALVFVYYFYELRRDAGRPAPQRALFRYASIVLVIATVVGGFIIVGSPADARSRGYDTRRITDLQQIQSQVVNFWQYKQKLPVASSELNDPLSGFVLPVDPATGEAYEYHAVGVKTFELCATFTTSANDLAVKPVSVPGNGDPNNEYWAHEKGRVCFERTIDGEKYPPAARVK